MRDSAVIGTDRVHAVLILDPGADPDEVVRRANTELADYQRIRTVSLWPYPEFPRTEGTGKLKRARNRQGNPAARQVSRSSIPATPLEYLTSLERVERMVALGLDESEIAGRSANRNPGNSLGFSNLEPRRLRPRRPPNSAARLPAAAHPDLRPHPNRRPGESRRPGASGDLRLQPPKLYGRPGDPCRAAPKWRYRVAPAMRKEFFHEHFHGKSFTNSLNYYLSTAFFNAFPIPQREPGALATLRYMGDLANERWCVLIFPEGKDDPAGRNRALSARRRHDRFETGNPCGPHPY